jgi:hypothetical protein
MSLSLLSLPTELLDQIVSLSQDLKFAKILRNYISPSVYNSIDSNESNILVYGQIQSGKTNAIINIITNPFYNTITKVLVIQNSLLVLKQYQQRFKNSNLDFQIINKNTKSITSNILLLINNSFRYKYFKKLNLNKYILLLDESDQTIKNCPLNSNAYKTYHITATPFNKTPQILYNTIYKIKPPNQYYDVNKLNVIKNTNHISIINEFLKVPTGIMLINKWIYVKEMTYFTNHISKIFPHIPVVLLTSDKILYHNNTTKHLSNSHSISQIIDSLSDYPHIIFIANRLSSRGLSYTSSDYKRHITHQISKSKYNITSFLQSLRILGVYSNSPKLYLFIDKIHIFAKHIDFLSKFNLKSLLIQK